MKLSLFISLFIGGLLLHSQQLTFDQIKFQDGTYYYNGTHYNGKVVKFNVSENAKNQEVFVLSDGKFDGKYEKWKLKPVQDEKEWLRQYKMVSGNYQNGMKEGMWIQFDDIGNKLTESQYHKNKKHGRSTKFYHVTHKSNSPPIKLLEQYDNEVLHGKRINYDVRGNTSKIENYYNGKLHGDYKEFFGDNISIEGNYKEGYKNGKWSFYDWKNASGDLFMEQEYRYGKLNGRFWYHNHLDGFIIESHLSNGSLDGQYIYQNTYDNIKMLGEFTLGIIEGSWVSYLNGTKLVERYFDAGVPKGVWNYWSEPVEGNTQHLLKQYDFREKNIAKFLSWYEKHNGKLLKKREFQFKKSHVVIADFIKRIEGPLKNIDLIDDQSLIPLLFLKVYSELDDTMLDYAEQNKHGERKEFWRSGEYEEYYNCVNGLLHGRYEKFYKNRKVIQGNYKDGKKNGNWMIWYNDGETKKRKERYLLGKPNGKWTFWNIKGQVDKIENYHMGRLQ